VRILIVSATSMETAPIVAGLQRVGNRSPRVESFASGSHDVDLLSTGIGMVATAAWCARTLSQFTYDLALNVGVCGSFDSSLPPGAVVHVTSDSIAELGAEDGDAFLTITQIGLTADETCVNTSPPSNPVLATLPSVRGITVNTVHGNTRSIADVVRRCAPQVESMEGAAFMYACAIDGVPFAQVRAVSNVVEQRNRGAWKLSEAIEGLGRTTREILSTL
jgi:futalosine hydrolase